MWHLELHLGALQPGIRHAPRLLLPHRRICMRKNLVARATHVPLPRAVPVHKKSGTVNFTSNGDGRRRARHCGRAQSFEDDKMFAQISRGSGKSVRELFQEQLSDLPWLLGQGSLDEDEDEEDSEELAVRERLLARLQAQQEQIDEEEFLKYTEQELGIKEMSLDEVSKRVGAKQLARDWEIAQKSLTTTGLFKFRPPTAAVAPKPVRGSDSRGSAPPSRGASLFAKPTRFGRGAVTQELPLDPTPYFFPGENPQLFGGQARGAPTLAEKPSRPPSSLTPPATLAPGPRVLRPKREVIADALERDLELFGPLTPPPPPPKAPPPAAPELLQKPNFIPAHTTALRQQLGRMNGGTSSGVMAANRPTAGSGMTPVTMPGYSAWGVPQPGPLDQTQPPAAPVPQLLGRPSLKGSSSVARSASAANATTWQPPPVSDEAMLDVVDLVTSVSIGSSAGLTGVAGTNPYFDQLEDDMEDWETLVLRRFQDDIRQSQAADATPEATGSLDTPLPLGTLPPAALDNPFLDPSLSTSTQEAPKLEAPPALQTRPKPISPARPTKQPPAPRAKHAASAATAVTSVPAPSPPPTPALQSRPARQPTIQPATPPAPVTPSQPPNTAQAPSKPVLEPAPVAQKPAVKAKAEVSTPLKAPQQQPLPPKPATEAEASVLPQAPPPKPATKSEVSVPSQARPSKPGTKADVSVPSQARPQVPSTPKPATKAEVSVPSQARPQVSSPPKRPTPATSAPIKPSTIPTSKSTDSTSTTATTQPKPAAKPASTPALPQDKPSSAEASFTPSPPKPVKKVVPAQSSTVQLSTPSIPAPAPPAPARRPVAQPAAKPPAAAEARQRQGSQPVAKTQKTTVTPAESTSPASAKEINSVQAAVPSQTGKPVPTKVVKPAVVITPTDVQPTPRRPAAQPKQPAPKPAQTPASTTTVAQQPTTTSPPVQRPVKPSSSRVETATTSTQSRPPATGPIPSVAAAAQTSMARDSTSTPQQAPSKASQPPAPRQAFSPSLVATPAAEPPAPPPTNPPTVTGASTTAPMDLPVAAPQAEPQAQTQTEPPPADRESSTLLRPQPARSNLDQPPISSVPSSPQMVDLNPPLPASSLSGITSVTRPAPLVQKPAAPQRPAKQRGRAPGLGVESRPRRMRAGQEESLAERNGVHEDGRDSRKRAEMIERAEQHLADRQVLGALVVRHNSGGVLLLTTTGVLGFLVVGRMQSSTLQLLAELEKRLQAALPADQPGEAVNPARIKNCRKKALATLQGTFFQVTVIGVNKETGRVFFQEAERAPSNEEGDVDTLSTAGAAERVAAATLDVLEENIGNTVVGTVVDVNGMFCTLQFEVMLESGDQVPVQGTIHRDQVSWEGAVDPSTAYELGQEVSAVVMVVDRVRQWVQLSARHAQAANNYLDPAALAAAEERDRSSHAQEQQQAPQQLPEVDPTVPLEAALYLSSQLDAQKGVVATELGPKSLARAVALELRVMLKKSEAHVEDDRNHWFEVLVHDGMERQNVRVKTRLGRDEFRVVLADLLSSMESA